MRHLEKVQPDSIVADLDENKQDFFETLSPEMKEEIPSFVLDENFIKNEFSSDDESIIGTNLTIDMKIESDGSEELDTPSKSEVKKNKRKASAPQRAVQHELSQSGSLGNSSESSQDNIDNLKFSNNQNLDDILAMEGETGLDFAEGDEIDEDLLQDINDVDIFKDLQEEAGMTLIFNF